MNPYERIMLDLCRKLCPKGYHVQRDGGGPRKKQYADCAKCGLPHDPLAICEGLYVENAPDKECEQWVRDRDAYVAQVESGVSTQEKFSLSEYNK